MSSQAPACPSCGYAGPLRAAAFAPVGAGGMVGGPSRRSETVLWQGRPSLKLLLVQALRTLIVGAAAVVAAIAIQPLASQFFADLSAGRSGRGARDERSR